MKKDNKLLADFVGEEVEWDYLYDEWVFKGYTGYEAEFGLWEPDQDWNQLMQVIKKMRDNPIIGNIVTPSFKYYLTTANIKEVYNEVVMNINRLELMSNESTTNPK